MDKLLEEIKFRAEHETRDAKALFAAMQASVFTMLRTMSMDREQVVSFCSCMIAMWQKREAQPWQTR